MAKLRILIEARTRRRRSFRRVVLAEFREILALLRQFWKPLVAFLVIIFGGAFLYALLTPPDQRMIAGRQIYFMLQLMVFGVDADSPTFPDSDPLRELFFFVMPVLGLTTVVSGVVGFGAALLNRSNRHEEWEVALASTYSNHVILCGVGHLGTRVLRQLLALQFDVVIIETNPDASGIEEAKASGEPLFIKDASARETLIEAGVERADALLICTDDDMANIAVTIHARELNPDLRIIVRMFNDSLAEQVREKLGADEVYSGSMLAAPIFASAATRTEVAQQFVVGDQTFSMARLEICPGSPLAGQAIAQIEKPGELDIVLHLGSGGARAHPDAETVVRAGDEIVVFAREDLLYEISRRNRVSAC